MEVFRPRLVTALSMTKFHTDDYINFLSTITPGACILHDFALSTVVCSAWAVPSYDNEGLLLLLFADNMGDYSRQLQRFNVGEDCPVFDGLFEYCQLYTSGSVGTKLYINI